MHELRSQNFRFSKLTFYTSNNFSHDRFRFYSAVCSLTPWCDATADLESAAGSTPRSFLSNFDRLTPRCDAHLGAFKNSNISAKLKPNLKILKPVLWGPGWVRIMKKIDVENLVTHSL